MPEPNFTIKQGDTTSILSGVVENSGGTAVSIQAATVIFRMAPVSGGTCSVAGTATIDQVDAGLDGSIGQLHYSWTPTDTAQAGLYAAEWQVTFSGGAIQTFPNGDPILVRITEDIAGG
jgi:hypothetical protein